MRVLLLPYVYHNRELSACSTVTEARDWLTDWFDRTDNLHVTWVVPSPDDYYWEPELLLADRDEVDTIVADRYMSDTDYRRTQGWTEEALLSVAEAKEEHNAYWDIVIDQNTYGGGYAMFQFLHELFDWTFASSRPFHYVTHFHDFNHPSKQHGNRWPNHSPPIMEMANHVIADSSWVKSEADSREAMRYSKKFFSASTIREVDDKLVQCGAAFDLDEFDREYDDEPTTVHIAGTTEAEKNWDYVFPICEALYERFNIKTIRTSMKPVEDECREAEWCDDRGQASYSEYLEALEEGDICFVCPDYATGGKTYYEQGASGQVMIFLKEPWVYDSMPEDYKLVVDSPSSLKKVAWWVVNNWDEAVREHSRAMDHFETKNDKSIVGRKTFEDMESLVQQRVDDYSTGWDEDVIGQAAEDLDDGFTVSQLNRATAKYTDKGDPLLDLYTYTLSDMVLCLKNLGYRDKPGSVEPRFTHNE